MRSLLLHHPLLDTLPQGTALMAGLHILPTTMIKLYIRLPNKINTALSKYNVQEQRQERCLNLTDEPTHQLEDDKCNKALNSNSVPYSTTNFVYSLQSSVYIYPSLVSY